jgi:hypothetical protein
MLVIRPYSKPILTRQSASFSTGGHANSSESPGASYVRLWHKADMPIAFNDVRSSFTPRAFAACNASLVRSPIMRRSHNPACYDPYGPGQPIMDEGDVEEVGGDVDVV